MLYSANTFRVSVSGITLLNKSLSEVNRRKIRKLELLLDTYHYTYGSNSDISLLAPVLPQLTKLTIVAQPLTIVSGGKDLSRLEEY